MSLSSASTTSLRPQSSLTLWPDDPRNTRLYGSAGELKYRVETFMSAASSSSSVAGRRPLKRIQPPRVEEIILSNGNIVSSPIAKSAADREREHAKSRKPTTLTTKITRVVAVNPAGPTSAAAFQPYGQPRKPVPTSTEVDVAVITMPLPCATVEDDIDATDAMAWERDPARYLCKAEVALGAQPPIPLRHWLPWGFQLNARCDEQWRMEDAQARRYEWRAKWDRQAFILELHAWDAPGAPIARYTRAYLDVDNLHGDATVQEVDGNIQFTARAKEVEDLVVVSCLLLDRLHRPAAMVGLTL